MKDPILSSEKILKKLSRRKLLRNSAITTAGIVLLLLFVTGCTKVWDYIHEHHGQNPGNIGGEHLITSLRIGASRLGLPTKLGPNYCLLAIE